ncbi:MAG: NifU family protein [Bacteroidales bacterium]|nr:NifU family protein [Bacteroidales bacterium]MBN2756110.1 NifU family protein [Bacteroidales bacterium]HES59350.1 NifU family protein [Caldithrix sp.]
MTTILKEELTIKIHKVLELVRPYLQTDGGDISFVELTEDFIVKVKLLGACGTCPMSIQTLKLGVEQTLQKSIPEITKVIAVDDNLQSIFPEDF